VFTEARHHLDVQYVAIAQPGAGESCSAESIALRWAPFDDLPSPTDAGGPRARRASCKLPRGAQLSARGPPT
jgi:hypothetical protein